MADCAPLPSDFRIDKTEQGLFCAAFRDGNAMADAAAVLKPEHFRSHAHQAIWAAALELFMRGSPVDAVAVGHLLNTRGQLGDVGGAAYLGELWESHQFVPAAVAFHADKIRGAAKLRHLHQASLANAHDAANPDDDADRIVERAAQRVLAVADIGAQGKTVSLAELMPKVAADIDARSQSGGMVGINTGLLQLDGITGGFRPGELVLIGARPGIGKTSFGLHLTRYAAGAGVPVLFVSLEQRQGELGERLLVRESGVSAQRIRLGVINDNEAEAVQKAMESLQRLATVHFDDTPAQGMVRIAATARRLKQRHGIGLIVLDYLQLVEPENRRDPRHEQVGQVSRRLKTLARELDIPVVALAQLNREVEGRGNHRPRPSDLRESGSLEADADVVLLLHEPEENGASRARLEVIIGKNRHGPTGEATLTFHRDRMLFEDGYESPFARGGAQAVGSGRV